MRSVLFKIGIRNIGIWIIKIFFFHLAAAQTVYVPMHTNEVLDQMEVGSNSLSGSTPAQSSMVNGATGYTIPITVPAGTGGVVPDMSINYTSSGRSSTFGYGWGLSGISVISRTGQSQYYDNNTSPISFNSSDRFLMDGNRLMLKSGTYGSSGSEYHFEAENFSVITAYGGTPGNPSYFVMETKEGIKYEFGKDNFSQNYHGPNLIKDWYISKMIYPDGNYITYSYKQNPTVSGIQMNQFILDEIRFTANDAAGITSFATVNLG